ncbi:MAG TPA: glycosyltransferase [Thermomicrobiales bacterium]|nr:glycosyltransferase [Thermomicrobiales bacterium]
MTRGHQSTSPFTPLVAPPPRPALRIAVVIPVRDEQECLPAALAALAGQRDLDGSPLDRDCYEIILLVNNSVDASAAIACVFARQDPSLALHVVEIDLPDDEAHVGRARRMLMDAAAARLPWNGVIATTDADTRVAPDWVATTLAEVAAGADAVAGRIRVDPTSFADDSGHARRLHLLDVTYRSLVDELEARLTPDPFDPWPRHFQHFGASMAVTVGAYRRVGGIPPLSSLEDVALYDALRAVNARIRHSPAVRVVTSARPVGRTGFGFAVQLQRWSAMGARHEPFLVEPPGAILARLAGQRSPAGPLVPIETAIADLRRLLAPLRREQARSAITLEQIEPVRLLAAAD